MAEIKSAGIIIYRIQNNKIEYLLLNHPRDNHWTPPKGGLDRGEESLDAAIRETEEETGLIHGRNYIFLDKSTILEVTYPRNGRTKRVTYWLARISDPTTRIKISNEHSEFKWLELNEALKLANWAPTEKILQEAENLLKKRLIS